MNKQVLTVLYCWANRVALENANNGYLVCDLTQLARRLLAVIGEYPQLLKDEDVSLIYKKDLSKDSRNMISKHD